MNQTLHQSLYHSLLRIGALSLAFILLFDSGLLHPATKQLSGHTQSYLANVISVGAAVAPTELNTITAQLTAEQRALDAREAALTEREIAVNLNEGGSRSSDLSTYLLSVILFILLVLIVLNYILDFTRLRRQSEVPA